MDLLPASSTARRQARPAGARRVGRSLPGRVVGRSKCRPPVQRFVQAVSTRSQSRRREVA